MAARGRARKSVEEMTIQKDAIRPKPPTDAELKKILGSASGLWYEIIHAVEVMFVPLEKEWKASKAEFGRMCLLRHKRRTLLYLTPYKEKVWIAIVLGERAYALAMKSSLPAKVKKMLSDSEALRRGPWDSFCGEFIARHTGDYEVGGDQGHT